MARRAVMATTQQGREAALAIDTQLVKDALIAANGNVTNTALALSIPRSTLDRRIKALGLWDWLHETYPLRVRQPTYRGQ